jgi:hypothetical protein
LNKFDFLIKIDPPGAPSTYSNNYPHLQNDIMNQSWSSHDINNQFYQSNAHSMAAGTSNMSYDPNQYVYNQMSNTFLNQHPQPVVEERPSKKVQFARSTQQQPLFKAPLTSTQSWHESSATTNDISTSTNRQEPVLSRQSVHRSAMPISDLSSTQASIQKPIYVGIDYKATLAERGQSTTNERQQKSTEKNHSDGLDSNQRARPHVHHSHHKSRSSNDSSSTSNTLQSNRSSEPLPAKLSNPPRSLTTTSTSTIIPNRQTQFTERQSNFDHEAKILKTRSIQRSQPPNMEKQSSFDNGIKIPKTRGIRDLQTQHTEQKSPVNNDIKASKINKHHSHHQQQHVTAHRNNSPSHNETIRRVENKQSTPVMRIAISQQQQRQKQSTLPSTLTNTANVARTRI